MAEKRVPHFNIEDEISQTTNRGQEIIAIVKSLISQIGNGQNEANSLLAAGKIREIEQTYPLAKRNYQAILESGPNYLEALARLAIVFLKMNNIAEGLTVAKQLIEQDRQFRFKDISGRPVSSMTILGDALRSNGDLGQAKAAYESALELQPDDQYAASKLAQLLFAEGNISHATQLADKFLNDSELESLKVTMRLLKKDPNRLPAIKGVVESIASNLARRDV